MKTPLALRAMLALSLCSVPAFAQQTAAPAPTRAVGPVVLEITALSGVERPRPEWSQQLVLAGDGRASARYSSSSATVVDVSVVARPGEAERIVLELDVREERSSRGGRSSLQTRQSMAIRRGETQVVQSVAPDGSARVLRVTVR